MPRIVVIFAILVSLPAVLSAQPQSKTKPKKSKPKAAIAAPAPAPAPAPEEIQAPVPPPTPEHGPASPPEVTYQNGKLTIVARNSTMGDVLNAVKQRTGAAVDMPPTSSERVVGRFGPGEPRDVMSQLLNGSHYDYVLLGSPADPGALKKIVLMARAMGPEPAPSQQAQNLRIQQNLRAVPEVENEQNQAEENTAEAPQEVAPQEEEAQPDQQDQQQGQQGQQNAPVVKTPEQLLRELQQQQQQQQQQQDQPPPGAPGQPPQ